VLETGESSTFFPSENYVSFWKELILWHKCFKMEIGSICSKKVYSAELKKHMYLSKENHLCYMLQHLVHCFPVSVQSVFERNTSCNLGLQDEDRFSLFQIDLFSWIEETEVSLQRKPSMVEAAASSTLFPCYNWVSFSNKNVL
jgi:hypothetical protein